jgi:fatty-acyl-CoA synthase
MSINLNQPHHAIWPARLPRELVLPETSLWFNTEVVAKRYPNKAAYLFCGRALTFAELHDQAVALAGWLQARGVARGDRVIVFMQNCPQFPIAVQAILRADAVVVPVNPMNKADEFGHYITDSGARVAITTADLAGIVAQADAGESPQRLRAAGHALHRCMPEGVDPMNSRSRRSYSGCGPASCRHCTLWRDAIAAGHVPRPRQRPRRYAVLHVGDDGPAQGLHPPAPDANAQRGRCRPVGPWRPRGRESGRGADVSHHRLHLLGGRSTCQRRDRGVDAALGPRAVRAADRAPSRVALDLHPHDDQRPVREPHVANFNLKSLRYLSGGGAAMPQAVASAEREFNITLPKATASPKPPRRRDSNLPERAKMQCLGIPIFGVDSRVVDPDTLKEMPIGESGEIDSHGPMIFKGYWGHPEATKAAFIEIDGKSFFRTGDLGRMDEEGYFFITDRLKRMINASGFKVWPAEVEALLYRNPAVQEACIIAARDAYRGETVKAVVVLREARHGDRVFNWAHEHMAAWVPKLVQFVGLPIRNQTGM